MAYLGLCSMIMAPLNGTIYEEGFRIGKAVNISIDPQYEDVSDYNDINDLDPEEEFQYADVKLTLTEEPEGLLGNMDEDLIEYDDIDPRRFYGMGLLRQMTSARYQAIWLTKTTLKESETSQDTKSEDIEYGTPEFTGKAYPDSNGIWKQQKNFDTKENALRYLLERANMEV